MNYDLTKFTSSVKAFTIFVAVEIISRDLLAKRKEDLVSNVIYEYVYSVLFKTINGLASANLLFGNLQGGVMHIDTGYLALRTLLSDNIIYLDLMLRSNGEQEKLTHNIKSLYYDHIKKDFENLGIFHSGLNINKEKQLQEIQGHYEQYREYYDGDKNALYAGYYPSVTKAVKNAISFPAKVNRELLMSAFNYYSRFSKYEHFGFYTIGLTHRQFKKENREAIFLEFFECVNIIVRFISSHIRTFYLNDEEPLLVKFKQFEAELLDLNSYKLPG